MAFLVERDIYVAKIEGRVYFATSHGIYKYNIHKDMMEPCNDMNNLLNGTAPIRVYWNIVIGSSV